MKIPHIVYWPSMVIVALAGATIIQEHQYEAQRETAPRPVFSAILNGFGPQPELYKSLPGYVLAVNVCQVTPTARAIQGSRDQDSALVLTFCTKAWQIEKEWREENASANKNGREEKDVTYKRSLEQAYKEVFGTHALRV